MLAATRPPGGRAVLVNGLDAWVETRGTRYALSSQRYADGTLHPDGAARVSGFDPFPWPRFTFRLEDGTQVEHEIVAPHGEPIVCLTWRLTNAGAPARLLLRPFLSGRDYHSLHHENGAFRFDAELLDDRVSFRPYPAWPAVTAISNGAYAHEPHWYRSFLYTQEQAHGLDCVEDLGSPGRFEFEAQSREAILVLGTSESLERFGRGRDAFALAHEIRSRERRRRRAFGSTLVLAGDAYLVKRGAGRTIVAGYPWFTDWGRDTFIAMRGLLLATGRLAEARSVLLAWAELVSQGMLPNRFPEADDRPEYNSVDAALWFVVAVHELLTAGAAVQAGERERLVRAVLAIVDGYARGTRHRIHMDADGLLFAGEPGVQLTWMDARVGDLVVTPRVGKPVEVQALWLNALRIASALAPRWGEVCARAIASFGERFWNPATRALFDVVEADGVAGATDARFRPNQILAVGGLPFPVLEGERARAVVDAVEARLVTPLGLRSLAADEPGYAARYEGGPAGRDAAYHQGTVWPWLLGPFVEAWVRTRPATAARREARERFLAPMLRHLEQEAGIGHISEIADGAPPHTPRGCPFQAWSLGEALRLELRVLQETQPAA